MLLFATGVGSDVTSGSGEQSAMLQIVAVLETMALQGPKARRPSRYRGGTTAAGREYRQ